MATRKKRKRSSKKKRSQAAKKGWETRRKNELLKKHAKANPELVGIEIQLDSQARRIKELEEYIEKREAKAIVADAVKKGLIPDDDEEIIKARLRIAISDGTMDEEAYAIADDFPDYGISEIFTLGYSPK